MRLATAVVALCILLIAGSLGAVAFLSLGFSPTGAAAVAATALAVLTVANALSGSGAAEAESPEAKRQLAELSRGTADLARQVGELARRVGVVETATREVAERSRKATEPLAAEMEVLATLLKELAESVAAHDTALQENAPRPPNAAANATPPPAAAPVPHLPAFFDEAALGDAPAPLPAGDLLRETARRFGHARSAKVAEQVRAALDANRLDLHLQPIVALPQRKVRYYEVLTRLRTDEGDLLNPPDFLLAAESAGLMPMLDNLMLLRAVRVLRRLTAKNRDVGLFCNIAGTTVVHDEFFPELLEFVSANRLLAPSLVLEFSQPALRAMGGVEHESLAQLASFGCRFSLDHVSDLQFEPRQLAERGFRFVKVPAALLLNKTPSAGADIHPSDLSDLLRRYGIDLIAEKIESEGAVVDLLDHDVRFGQGFLFSPPRPVRAEVFGSAFDRAAESDGEAVRPPRAASVAADTDLPRAVRRREPDPSAPSPSAAGGPRTPSALAKLAREMVRRA